ncbi:TVP38/TMEM64 family protein [Roseateles oligotrophus]|uniref:TVP38/TMEM64 family membrane protein n=1 Tax=Roseateles oligotrophus TaxID=1769250 RepID=A0ABT2YLJ3_9BURK|nr:VTT domain-containing protein [Roseateles oligotrophus]MCV2370918.1 VTT domain-containing protein [Roseateles oligotrophus]
MKSEAQLPAAAPPQRRLRLRVLLLALAITSLLGLAMFWSVGKFELAPLLAQLQNRGRALGPGLATLTAAVGLTLAVPLSVLSLLLIAALGPWLGFACSMGAALMAAAISHMIGRSLGHQALLRLAGPRVRQVSERLGGRGVWSVITLRLLPLAPFAVVNMVAGATHIRLRDMLLGTAIGMSPSTLAMAFFMDTLLLALKDPGRYVWHWLSLPLALLALALAIWGWRRTIGRQQEQ